jgi:hypothetical protein
VEPEQVVGMGLCHIGYKIQGTHANCTTRFHTQIKSMFIPIYMVYTGFAKKKIDRCMLVAYIRK